LSIKLWSKIARAANDEDHVIVVSFNLSWLFNLLMIQQFVDDSSIQLQANPQRSGSFGFRMTGRNKQRCANSSVLMEDIPNIQLGVSVAVCYLNMHNPV
jgi:hypothetical protein